MSQLAPITSISAEPWNEDRKDFIRKNFCSNAPDQYIEPYLDLCQRRNLSPEAKHIFLVPRWNSRLKKEEWVPQVSIDGYRLMAARTGQYAGSDEPIFIEGDRHPIKATVTVYRVVQGVRCPFTASAYWEEYVPKEGQDFMWKKMGHVMLAKVAESAALRKAFPEDLSGMYTDAEMDQANTGHVQEATFREVRPQELPDKDVHTPLADAITGEIVSSADDAPDADGDARIYDALEAKGAERSVLMKALVSEGVDHKNVDLLRKLIAYTQHYHEAKAIYDLTQKRGITDPALTEALNERVAEAPQATTIVDKDHLGKGSITEATRKKMFATQREAKVSDEDVKAHVKREFGLESRTELSEDQAEKVIIWLNEMKDFA